MGRFEKFIKIIFKNEGFYSNDKSDSGGETKYGISKNAYPNLDIKNLTIEQAEEIYMKDYYFAVRADQIKNELLALHVFDMAVNAGVNRAIKILQKVVGASIDGKIGQNTLKLANGYDYSTAYINARIDYYKGIGVGKNAKFLKGWLNRVVNTTNSI